MRNIRFVSYFTILLVLLQSFSAVANSLDFHAIDPQHLVEVHQHSDDDSVDGVSDEDGEPFYQSVKKSMMLITLMMLKIPLPVIIIQLTVTTAVTAMAITLSGWSNMPYQVIAWDSSYINFTI